MINNSVKETDQQLLHSLTRHSFDIDVLNSTRDTAFDFNSNRRYFDTNIFSRLLFSWVSPIVKHGNSVQFDQDQHYDLQESEDCGWIGEKFANEWQHCKNKKYPMYRTHFRAIRSLVVLSQILAFIQTCFEFTGPILVSKIIKYIAAAESTTSEGVTLIIAFVVSRVGLIIVSTQATLINNQILNKLRKGTMALIYRKFLKFPLMRNQEHSAGSIMNHLLVDVENLSKIYYFLPQLTQFPVMLIIGLSMIYSVVGIAFIGGVATVVVIGLLISWIGRNNHRCQRGVMAMKDVRMKRTNEILIGIKYIKMCGIEEKFLELVTRDRENELLWVKKKHLLASLRIFLFWLSPVLLSISIFGCYLLFGNSLTPQTAFVVLSTLMIVQGPVFNIGNILNDVLQGQVSMERVQKFMFNEEIDTSYIAHSRIPANETAIKITNGNFYWVKNEKSGDLLLGNAEHQDRKHSSGHPHLILRNINMQIKRGSFVAILGDVGSGKSSMFNALLGEMLYDSQNPASIEINGNITYVAQKPWIVNATIKDNITFENEYDERAYEEAITSSCLRSDLETFIKKDETEIGEKGVNLSGGQKARIALARAIYSNSDIYLLDDPLSAVDAHVGKYILEKCLTGKLKDKTRVLITHKLESLKYVDHIYILKAGEIVAEGDFETIKKSCHFQEIEENVNKEVPESENNNTPAAAVTQNKTISSSNQEGRQAQQERNISDVKDRQNSVLDKLMLSEDRQSGAVTFSTWKTFFSHFGNFPYFLLLVGVIISWISLKTGSDFWLAHWSRTAAESDSETNNKFYYGIYVAIGLSSGFFVFLRVVLVVLRGIKVSRKLHNDMFNKIIRAPVNLFFDRIPLGRLINRFASDLDLVDSSLPFTLGGLLYYPVNLLSKFIMCYVAGTAWALPLMFLFVWIGLRLQKRYVKVYREVYRLTRITSSPVTSMFAESLDGLTQIRSCNYQQHFLTKYASLQNENFKNQILLVALQGWFNIRINLSSMLIVIPTVSVAILFSQHIGDSPALLGLLITYLLDLSGSMIQVLQQLGVFEAQLISFERCRAFTEVQAENESKTFGQVTNYSSSWPQNGEIEFKNYFAKYRPNLPFVLRNVSFKIHGGEKIGVVGRTGSGKSTTLLSLLRIIEAHSGQIFIDGVDISKLGLDDLRRKITIIPQDPLLYKGTLRTNLDLLGQYKDQDIWTALEKVHMNHKFKQFGLSSDVKEGGENFSAGEKQLLCIARAILNKNKVILVDEATSSIDNVTEETIIESIHENFKDCTMITIAHRLKTIIGSDKILFMENGNVIEFDSPINLLKNKHGHFYQLWKEYEQAKS